MDSSEIEAQKITPLMLPELAQEHADFRPKKETVISLAVGLKLSLNEAEDFLQCAGYAFSDTDKADVIAKELFSQKNYDKFDWSQWIYEKTGRMFFKSEGM